MPYKRCSTIFLPFTDLKMVGPFKWLDVDKNVTNNS